MSFSYIMSYLALLLVISHRDILIVWLLHPYSKHTTIIWFILCSRTYTLQCYMWIFFTVWISIENHPSELMQVKPQLSRSNCKYARETSVSLPGMTGILLISLLSSFLSPIHQTHTPSFQLERINSKASGFSGLQISAWNHSCCPSSSAPTLWTDTFFPDRSAE